MPDEVFINSVKLFQQAFVAEDPTHSLLHLLNKQPTYAAVKYLVIAYFEAVRKDPFAAQSFASTLVAISNSPDAPTFEQETLLDILADELAGMHFKYYGLSDRAKELGPTNKHLIDCLLSGLSLRFELTYTNDMYAIIVHGLKVKGCSEVKVVGSCIQLLLSGSAITTELADPYRKSAKEVAKKLKAQRKRGTVKDPRALQVLEVCYLCNS
jgi:uncharacterized protein (UPF0147 family)